MNELNNYLYLIWKDPVSRRNFTIGKLSKVEKFTFEYCEDYKEAEKFGWERLKAFPEDRKYESDIIFPVFSSRLPDKKRRDIAKILEKYGLIEFDEFELLRKSEGRLPIDTYLFIDPIFPKEQSIQRDFFIMGIRYNAPCEGINCKLLPQLNVGEEVIFKEEPSNEYDSNAVQVLTKSQELLGYLPRYYNSAILERLHKCMTYSCKIIDIKRDKDCSECIKVRLTMPKKEN